MASNSDSSRRVRIVGLRPARRRVVDRRGQVGQEAARAGEGLVLAVDRLVDRAGAQLDLPAAQLLLVVLLGAEAVHHRRAGDEHRRDLLHHHRVVRGGEPRRAEARRPSRGPAPTVGTVPMLLHHPFPAAHARHVGAAGGLDGLDRAAAARALDHADQRHAILVGVALDEDVLFLDRGVGRAAAHGEVVAGHGDGPAVDLGAAHHGVGRHQVHQVVACRRTRPCRRCCRSRGSESLSTSRSMRSRTVSRPPSCWRFTLSAPPISPGHLLAAAQLVHFRLPGHRCFPSRCFNRQPARSYQRRRRTGYTESRPKRERRDRWTKPRRLRHDLAFGRRWRAPIGLSSLSNQPMKRSSAMDRAIASVVSGQRIINDGDMLLYRALPTVERVAVGPFVFVDHYRHRSRRGIGDKPHPHAGIEVVSYLLEGGVEHRDSMGFPRPAGTGRCPMDSRRPRHPPCRAARGRPPWPAALDQPAAGTEIRRTGLRLLSRGRYSQDRHRAASRLRVIAGRVAQAEGPMKMTTPTIFALARLEPGAAACARCRSIGRARAVTCSMAPWSRLAGRRSARACSPC